jgi:hypothetical protein
VRCWRRWKTKPAGTQANPEQEQDKKDITGVVEDISTQLQEHTYSALRNSLAADVATKYADKQLPVELMGVIRGYLWVVVSDVLPQRSRLSVCRNEVSEKFKPFEANVRKAIADNPHMQLAVAIGREENGADSLSNSLTTELATAQTTYTNPDTPLQDREALQPTIVTLLTKLVYYNRMRDALFNDLTDAHIKSARK